MKHRMKQNTEQIKDKKYMFFFILTFLKSRFDTGFHLLI